MLKNLLYQFGKCLIWLLIEAEKLCGGLVRQGFEAKKYYPQQSKVWRFICPNPKGTALPAEEV